VDDVVVTELFELNTVVTVLDETEPTPCPLPNMAQKNRGYNTKMMPNITTVSRLYFRWS
jgi:hypothetical protein